MRSVGAPTDLHHRSAAKTSVKSQDTPVQPSDVGPIAHVACRWCGAELKPRQIPADMYVVHHCANCGVGLTMPYPDAAQLRHAYGTWYRPQSGRFVGAGDWLLAALRGRTARWVHHISPEGPILDVGAGSGAMLDAFRRAGRTALGLERQSTRPDVREGTIAESGDDWAAIVMWHSLEHLPNPRASLKDAALRLRHGGLLAVAIPNFASMQCRVFGPRWLHLDLPRHLTHLSQEQLVTALQEEGLIVLKVSHVRGGQVVFGWLHGFVGWFPGHPDLYQALRRGPAREANTPLLPTVAAAALVAPLALLFAGVEVFLRRGGTICVVARRSPDPIAKPERVSPSI